MADTVHTRSLFSCQISKLNLQSTIIYTADVENITKTLH